MCRYRQASRQIFDIFKSSMPTATLEKAGIDEAFLGMDSALHVRENAQSTPADLGIQRNPEALHLQQHCRVQLTAEIVAQM